MATAEKGSMPDLIRNTWHASDERRAQALGTVQTNLRFSLGYNQEQVLDYINMHRPRDTPELEFAEFDALMYSLE